jgi:hypothetical protein
MVTFFTTTLVFSAPWYARNLFEFGNPFFPAMNGLLGQKNAFTALDVKLLDEMTNGLTGYSWHSGSIADFIGKFFHEFGWFVCVVGTIGGVLSVVQKSNKIRQLVAVILFTVIAVTIRFGFWEPRYVISIAVLLTAMGAAFADTIASRFAKYMWAPLNSVLYWAALSFVSVIGIYNGASIYGPLVAQYESEPRTKFLAEHVSFWRVADYLNTHISKNAKVAIGVGVQPFYYLERPYYNLHPLTELGNLSGISSADDFMALLRQQGVDYVALWKWDPGAQYTPERTPRLHEFLETLYSATDKLVEKRQLVPLSAVENVVIYKVAN